MLASVFHFALHVSLVKSGKNFVFNQKWSQEERPKRNSGREFSLPKPTAKGGFGPTLSMVATQTHGMFSECPVKTAQSPSTTTKNPKRNMPCFLRPTKHVENQTPAQKNSSTTKHLKHKQH